MCLEVELLKGTEASRVNNLSRKCLTDLPRVQSDRFFPDVTLASVRLTTATQHTYFPFQVIVLLIMCVFMHGHACLCKCTCQCIHI